MNGDLIERYDRGLSRSRGKLPEGVPCPCPSTHWPEENIRLFEKYRDWLLEGGAGEYSCKNNYLPTAGYILGLNPVPVHQMDLVKDNFLVFTNARTEKINVLYRRKAGNYGLIQPNS